MSNCGLCNKPTNDGFPVKTMYKNLKKKVYHISCVTNLYCDGCCRHMGFEDIIDVESPTRFTHKNCKSDCINKTLAITYPILENMVIHTLCSKTLRCKTCNMWRLPGLPEWSLQTCHMYPNEIKVAIYTFLLSLKRLLTPMRIPRDIRNIIIAEMATSWGASMWKQMCDKLCYGVCTENRCRGYSIAIGNSATVGNVNGIAIGPSALSGQYYNPYYKLYGTYPFDDDPYSISASSGSVVIGAKQFKK